MGSEKTLIILDDQLNKHIINMSRYNLLFIQIN